MAEPKTVREAKEFLISSITEEAKREDIQLSEIERKMLYFTETGWTPFDFVEVNDAFEASYDTATYEAKISNLIRNLVFKMRREDPAQFKLWAQAVRTLSVEDHYLLVLIGTAEGKFSMAEAPRSSDSQYFRRVILFVVLCGLVLSAVFAAYTHLQK